jgi:hypothetical protein
MRARVSFTLFVFVYVEWCLTHIVLCFCYVFLRLVCPMLPVSLCFCYVFLRLVCPMLPVSLCFCYVFLRLVYPMLPVSLCFCYVCHRLVYPMLPVSLDCLFFDCPFGILCANGLSHPYAILLIKLERGGVNNHVVVLPSFLDANVF